MIDILREEYDSLLFAYYLLGLAALFVVILIPVIGDALFIWGFHQWWNVLPRNKRNQSD